MDVKKLIYFCNSNFWYDFEVPIESIYNLCNEIRSSFNHLGHTCDTFLGPNREIGHFWYGDLGLK